MIDFIRALARADAARDAAHWTPAIDNEGCSEWRAIFEPAHALRFTRGTVQISKMTDRWKIRSRLDELTHVLAA